jgi:REP element-mobilizing transposase RayT
MLLHEPGQIAVRTWEGLPKHYAHVDLDAFVVMPNHIHGILFLTCTPADPKRHPLSEILRAFKSFSARHINYQKGTPGQPVWQRNYIERVIRSEAELHKIRRYIAENPAKWESDRENPRFISPG